MLVTVECITLILIFYVKKTVEFLKSVICCILFVCIHFIVS